MATALSFLKRDFFLALSYRLSFVLQIATIFFSVASAYFLSRLFGSSVVPQLEEYGGDYFSFVLIGIAFTGYLGLSLSTFSESIREGQITGTLEIMLLSPTRLSVILLSSSIWPYLLTTINVIFYVILGVAVFDFSISQANFLTAVVVLVLSIASFASIGILSAAMVLVVKRGDPISWVYGGISTLLAGVYYPIAVLPDWLRSLSHVIPMTYSLDAMRLAMLKGATLYEIRVDILVLLGFTVVMTPLALYAFRKALMRAKKEGSLIQY